MSRNDLTVIINTFNSDEKIYSCLDSIKQDIKILIVENSNNKNFKDTIERKYSNVVCELTGENLGYAKGNNFGLSKVDTKYALILNPDTVIEKNTLDNFFQSATKYKDFSIIAPAIQEEKSNKKKIDKVTEVDNVKGFAMFLNLIQFKDIGFFDENFFIYFEEIDLCKRLKAFNKKIYLDPNIIINHLGGSSHNVSINFEMELSRNWHWMWSTFYYHKKYKGFLFSFIIILPKLSSAIVKVMVYTLFLNKFKKQIYYQRLSGLINSILGKNSWYRPRV